MYKRQDTRWYFNGYSEVPLVIHVDHRDNTGAYTISIDYQTDFFSGTEIELLRDRILNLVEQIVCTSDMIVGSLQIMTEKESQRIIEAFNATKTRHSIQKVDRIINPYSSPCHPVQNVSVLLKMQNPIPFPE